MFEEPSPKRSRKVCVSIEKVLWQVVSTKTEFAYMLSDVSPNGGDANMGEVLPFVKLKNE